MNNAVITKYDEELVEISKRFLKAARENAESCAILEKFGFTPQERERGERLVRETLRSFEWEREGKAYNFLSPTPERRVREARGWYADTRRRWARACFRRAEEEAGWVGARPARSWPTWKKATLGTVIGIGHAARAASPIALRDHLAKLRRDIEVARGPRPVDAPPPMDSALVELAGWYERWRLLAQRVFRQRPEMMAPYGLTPGKAPPRLRGKDAKKYGEKAAGSSLGATSQSSLAEVDDDDAEEIAPPPPQAPQPSGRPLPIVR